MSPSVPRSAAPSRAKASTHSGARIGSGTNQRLTASTQAPTTRPRTTAPRAGEEGDPEEPSVGRGREQKEEDLVGDRGRDRAGGAVRKSILQRHHHHRARHEKRGIAPAV